MDDRTLALVVVICSLGRVSIEAANNYTLGFFRGAEGLPWLITRIQREWRNRPITQVTITGITADVREHLAYAYPEETITVECKRR